MTYLIQISIVGLLLWGGPKLAQAETRHPPPEIDVELAVLPSNHHEECRLMKAGMRLDDHFGTDASLAFDLHSHNTRGRGHTILKQEESFSSAHIIAKRSRVYCLRWENISDEPISLSYRISLSPKKHLPILRLQPELTLIQTEGQPLSDIIEALHQLTHGRFTFIGPEQIWKNPVYVDIQTQRFEKAISRLLKEHNHILEISASHANTLHANVLDQPQSGSHRQPIYVPRLPHQSSDRDWKPPETTQKTIAALTSTVNPKRRLDLIQELGFFEDPAALPILIKTLNDPNVEIKLAAVEALQWIPIEDPSQLDPVSQILESPQNPLIQLAAIDVLINNPSDRSFALFERLQADLNNPNLAEAATQALEDLEELLGNP